MFYLRFAGLFGKSWSRKRTRRTPVTKRFTRPLALLRLECLEDRRLLTAILGSAQDFAVLGHTTVTNTGSTVIFGSAGPLANVGVFNLGTAADTTTGFAISPANTFVGPGTNTAGPGLVNAPAKIHLGSPGADQARNDLITAYNALAV